MNNTEKAMIKQNRNKEVALFVIVLPRARRRDVFRPRPAGYCRTVLPRQTFYRVFVLLANKIRLFSGRFDWVFLSEVLLTTRHMYQTVLPFCLKIPTYWRKNTKLLKSACDSEQCSLSIVNSTK